MTIFHWLGQACFLITTALGTHVLIDPPNPQVGYHITAHSIPAKLVFVSHDHPDHNYIDAVKGTMKEIPPLTAAGQSATGAWSSTDHGISEHVPYERIFAYHDNVQGKKRGPDTLTVINTDGLRIVHLGDIGELSLTPDQIKAIGHVDVLMIPVGGFYTVDGTQAAALVAQLHPRVILPMHYGTPQLNPDLRTKLAPVTVFLNAMKGKAAVVTVKTRDLSLSPKTLPKSPTIYLLRYQ